jgi:peptidyl-prolyl cis-trans isomerase SurA
MQQRSSSAVRQAAWAVGAGLALLLAGSSARAEVVDRVAAVVNQDIITLSEVEERAAPEMERLSAERDPKKRAEARQALLLRFTNQLIGEKLMDKEIKELGLSATEREVDQAIDDVLRQNNLESREALEERIRAEGLSMKTYREVLAGQMSRMKLVQLKVSPRVKLTEADLRAEYAQYTKNERGDAEVHARHILLQLPKNAPADQVEATRKRALAIVAEARRPGMDFEALARARSEGPSAADGGDLGFFRRGQMVPAFDKVVFGLKVGEVSEPVRTDFGWHVIKVEERRAVDVPKFDDLREQLAEKLRREKTEKFVEQYVAELRRNAIVQVKL